MVPAYSILTNRRNDGISDRSRPNCGSTSVRPIRGHFNRPPAEFTGAVVTVSRLDCSQLHREKVRRCAGR